MTKIGCVETNRGQRFQPGDQVAYSLPPKILTNGSGGYLHASVSGGEIRVGRVKEIIMVTTGFAEADPCIVLKLENMDEIGCEAAVRTDQNYK